MTSRRLLRVAAEGSGHVVPWALSMHEDLVCEALAENAKPFLLPAHSRRMDAGPCKPCTTAGIVWNAEMAQQLHLHAYKDGPQDWRACAHQLVKPTLDKHAIH